MTQGTIRHTARAALIALACLGAWAASVAVGPTPALATGFVVNNSTADLGDASPGNNICATVDSVCTLRAAMEEANAHAGADTITFAPSLTTIAPTSQLPSIADPAGLTIDGTVTAGRIEIAGHNAGANSTAFLINAPFTLRDTVINRFDNRQIYFSELGPAGPIVIEGNYIGTDTSGTVDLSGGDAGIQVDGSGPVTIGGPLVSQRNVISGHPGAGIEIDITFTGVATIRNNYIGTNGSGTAALGNTQGIGGGGTAASSVTIVDNLISGNTDYGILIGGSAGSFFIESNRIGTEATGLAPLPNVSGGIQSQATGFVRIGAAAAGTGRNTISGNGGAGVWLSAGSGAQVLENYIGVGSDGVAAVGNGGSGVLVNQPNAQVGFTGRPNVIANNGGDGVGVIASAGTNIEENRIFSNGGLGIDLGPNGVTANDALDADSGPNSLQNFPVVTKAFTNGSSSVTIASTINTTASTGVTVTYYASPSCDPSGNGEGQTVIGGAGVVTDASGNGMMETSHSASVAAGSAITAIARVSGTGTSEFSACYTAVLCVAGDTDCDGFMNPAQTSHQGPANTNTAFDNCPSVANPLQLNSDGNFIDLSPPKAYDDLTWPNSDALGDACDPDDDNDGTTDVNEADESSCASAFVATNPVLRDTDGDLFLDSYECAIGTDPTNIASLPGVPAAGTDPDHDNLPSSYEAMIGTNPSAFDSDGDTVHDGVEVRNLGTNPLAANTDGDICPDAKEVASVNSDNKVDSIDLSQAAQHFAAGGYPLPASALNADFDMNKDRRINSIDIAFISGRFGVC